MADNLDVVVGFILKVQQRGRAEKLIVEGGYGTGKTTLVNVLRDALPGLKIVDADPYYSQADFVNEDVPVVVTQLPGGPYDGAKVVLEGGMLSA